MKPQRIMTYLWGDEINFFTDKGIWYFRGKSKEKKYQ
jgi:hypothetical protein